MVDCTNPSRVFHLAPWQPAIHPVLELPLQNHSGAIAEAYLRDPAGKTLLVKRLILTALVWLKRSRATRNRGNERYSKKGSRRSFADIMPSWVDMECALSLLMGGEFEWEEKPNEQSFLRVEGRNVLGHPPFEEIRIEKAVLSHYDTGEILVQGADARKLESWMSDAMVLVAEEAELV